MMAKYEYHVPTEVSEMADGMRYKFKNLITMSVCLML